MQVMDKIVCCIFCIILLYVSYVLYENEQAFTSYMISVEKAAWCSYVSVAQDCLSNTFVVFL